MSERAFSNDIPEVVAAYKAAAEASRAAGLRAIADAERLGCNDGPAVSRGMWGLPDVIPGLFPADRAVVPDGWRYVAGSRMLQPRRGRSGAAAQAWLDDHILPPDARSVLADHGLPYYSRNASDAGRYALNRPHIFYLDSVLWVRYRGVIDGDCTWTPRKLSEFYAAQEAAEEASKEINESE